jgi:hypothetical protein
MSIPETCSKWLENATPEELKIKGGKYAPRAKVTFWLWTLIPDGCKEILKRPILSGASDEYIIPMGLAEAIARDNHVYVGFFCERDERYEGNNG